MERIDLTPELYLLKIKGKFVPYHTGHGPIRGFNKRGVQVWRSYKSVDEAKLNLGVA